MSIFVSLNDPIENTLPVNNQGSNAGQGQELQDQFLTLLVTQLRNQDPSNPMDSNDLITQLAQISTVSGIEKLNTTLGAIAGQINSNQSLQASNLIDRGVLVPGNSILTGRGEQGMSTTPLGFELENGAQSVVISISDMAGRVVKQLDLGSQRAGVHSYTWDGKGEDGLDVPDGAYTFSVSATQQGQPVLVQPLHYGRVSGVTKDGDQVRLELGLIGAVTLEDVRQIL